MILQKQPNKWSCIPTSFAMCLDIPVDQVIKDLDHDGSSLLDGEQRQGFHPQELIYYAYKKGYYVISFEMYPECINEKGESFDLRYIIASSYKNYSLMNFNPGVLVGKTKNNKLHSVAWDSKKIYDPNYNIYNLKNDDGSYNFNIDIFYLIGKIL